MDLISECRKRARHRRSSCTGPSSVPEELVDEVNKYGGKMPGAMGVPIAPIQEAVQRGIQKINVDTDGRLAVTGAIRKVFFEKPGEFDPRKYLGPPATPCRSSASNARLRHRRPRRRLQARLACRHEKTLRREAVGAVPLAESRVFESRFIGTGPPRSLARAARDRTVPLPVTRCKYTCCGNY